MIHFFLWFTLAANLTACSWAFGQAVKLARANREVQKRSDELLALMVEVMKYRDERQE